MVLVEGAFGGLELVAHYGDSCEHALGSVDAGACPVLDRSPFGLIYIASRGSVHCALLHVTLLWNPPHAQLAPTTPIRVLHTLKVFVIMAKHLKRFVWQTETFTYSIQLVVRLASSQSSIHFGRRFPVEKFRRRLTNCLLCSASCIMHHDPRRALLASPFAH